MKTQKNDKLLWECKVGQLLLFSSFGDARDQMQVGIVHAYASVWH